MNNMNKNVYIVSDFTEKRKQHVNPSALQNIYTRFN